MRRLLPTNAIVRRTVLITAGVLGSLAIAGSLFAISGDSKTKPVAVTPVFELTATDVMTVRPQSLLRTLRISGSLTPVRHATIKSRSAGTLLEIRAHEGQRVRSGALLVRIDPRNAQAELSMREAALRKAQADLSLAAKNHDTSFSLLKNKLISQNSFDQIVATLDASVANQDAAAAQVQLAKNALEDTEIRADFDGVVATRNVQVGERVTPDMPLLSIVDLSQMQLEALVPAADVPGIKASQTARFKVDGFGERTFTGRVERINPQTESGSRSLTVYIAVVNADGALKGGMFAEGDLVLAQTLPVLAVPHEAIRTTADQHYVLVLENDTVSKRAVEVGESFSTPGLTVIHKGLAEAMQVIVAPITALKPGMRAKLAAG